MKLLLTLTLIGLLNSCSSQPESSQDIALETIKAHYATKQYKNPKNDAQVADVKLVQSFTVADSLSVLASRLIPLLKADDQGYEFSIQSKLSLEKKAAEFDEQIASAKQESRKQYLRNEKKRFTAGLETTKEWVEQLEIGMRGEQIDMSSWSDGLKSKEKNSFDIKRIVNDLNDYNRLKKLEDSTVLAQLYYASIQYQSTSTQIVNSVGEHLLSLDEDKYLLNISDFDPNYSTYKHEEPEYSFAELDALIQGYIG
ncbi:MAG: hypothetical protein ACI8ZM_002783 [Crocinitomix sp.]|jgi:hypothetical protein